MRIFGSSYRDLPRFMLRRIDHVAGQLNGLLLVVAISLAMLNVLYFVQKFVDRLPSQIGTHAM